MELKYIITDTKQFAIFSKVHDHSDMSRGMYGTPVGAGFCTIEADVDNEIIVTCWGESVSLKLESHELDGYEISRQLNNN